MNKAILTSIKPPYPFEGQWNRSSKRTDLMHEQVVDHIRTVITDFDEKYTVKYEYKIDDPINKTGKTKVDIVIFKDNEMKLLIPVKAYVSNVNQNSGNYANTSLAEAFRFNVHYPNTYIIFLTLYPRRAPYFKSGGVFKQFQRMGYVELIQFNTNKVYFTGVGYDTNVEDPENKIDYINSINNEAIENICTTGFDTAIKEIL